MLVTAVIGSVVASGASVLASSKQAKAAKNAASQQAADNAAAVAAANSQAELDRQAAAKQTADLLASSKQQSDATIAALTAQNQQSLDQISKQSADFQTQQQALMDAQTKAAADAAKRADDAIKNTGQAARAPNYSKSSSANADANRGGISSTMLTGAQGVNAAMLSLGKSSMLGA